MFYFNFEHGVGRGAYNLYEAFRLEYVLLRRRTQGMGGS